jgi:hypothetical protein
MMKRNRGRRRREKRCRSGVPRVAGELQLLKMMM